VNKYAAVLRRQGVRAIVAVVHEGFSQQSGAGYDECVNPFGPAAVFNARISPDVDAIVTGHWHALVNCMLPDPAGDPRPVVEAANHGRLINEINLQLEPETGEVLRDRTTSVNHANTKDVTPDPETLRIAEYWRQKSVTRGNTPVAKVTADLTRAPGDTAESTLYNATADAFHWAANEDGRADLGVAMPGILRNDIRYAANPANPADAPGRVLFSEVALGTACHLPDRHAGEQLLRQERHAGIHRAVRGDEAGPEPLQRRRRALALPRDEVPGPPAGAGPGDAGRRKLNGCSDRSPQ
jgi:5'-nucleotidase